MEFLLTCFIAGLVLAIPAWIIAQRSGARRGFVAARHFDPDDAVTCDIEPVALRARLLPDPAPSHEVSP
ncbi:hypothetical protein [Paraburkholderia saeva]|uniref:Uncharacterized protein n=1 Tax=Paraburkholderia saeva TaxID=2777537 RepID=A0A9N8X2H2_9BURK|nr:hypothetical protein R52603_01027 [Paraburkholderia saeva]CAG4896747.1 hypothetical protein R70241_02244 [Paraburkholderia saeva]CAG4901554.1 hypothetical protein LMG31841_03005 [Paraburkholderia saeva]